METLVDWESVELGSLTTSWSWSWSWSRSRSRSRSELGWGWDLRFLRTKKPARVAERNIRISLSGHISRKTKKCQLIVNGNGNGNGNACVIQRSFFWIFLKWKKWGKGKKVRREGGCSWSLVKFGCSSFLIVYCTHTISLSLSLYFNACDLLLSFFCPFPLLSFSLKYFRNTKKNDSLSYLWLDLLVKFMTRLIINLKGVYYLFVLSEYLKKILFDECLY